ncbi:MAG: multidrug effflux MFS transporter, partial [Alphaproteobacteria bacterium]|nr:multidrug effflux MFS transporter [Alphaproteobacteria bacterium]
MTAPADPPHARHVLLVGMLGALCALGPLALSMHVQSIPVIVADLRSDYATVQLTVSLFLATFGLGMLLVGPISDRLGRRPVLFGGLVLFTAAAAIAALAPTADTLIAARVGQ